MDSRARRASGAFAVLSAFLLAGCPVDERPLGALPIFWIPASGQGGDGEAGNPNPFEAGTGGDAKGGTQAMLGGGGGGTAGSAGSGAGRSGAGNGGNSAGSASEAGAPPEPAPGCEDLDSDGVPDCQETLVKNGSFDTNAANWVADENFIHQTWAQPDANEQLESGSLTITNVNLEDTNGYTVSGTQQCININETGAYHFVAQLYIVDGQGEGNAGVNLWFLNLPDCQGAIVNTASQFAGKVGVWQLVYANPVTPMGARSVAVRLVAAKPFRNPQFSASFDNILFVQD